ncbi:DUF1189 family protein [Virgibacillus sp. C22-A2]|uniref:DUF1189 family protein n=1 Tax=Virgibacillus tibetensis TaxID=3042313 RepID=A0ABU6KIN9_9BACI|nr:DUF1189 family protein [Virgibacillus sp. C22-A2]
MIFLQAFVNSIKLPNKKAIFKLNRVGMDIAVIYMFILLVLVSIPSLIEQLTTMDGQSAELNLFFQSIYFFIFYFLPLVLIVFLLLSLIAYIGSGIAHLMRRKLRYSILWKMSAFTTTVPVILYTLLALIFPLSNTWLWLFFMYSIVFLILIISVYPKRRVRS